VVGKHAADIANLTAKVDELIKPQKSKLLMVQSNTVPKEWFVTAGIDDRKAFAPGMLRFGLIEMRVFFRKSGYCGNQKVKERAMLNSSVEKRH